MLRLIKRGETESFNQSLGLFNMNIFQIDQDGINQTLKRNTCSSKIRTLCCALPGFMNVLEVCGPSLAYV